jgi:hypothetical protein
LAAAEKLTWLDRGQNPDGSFAHVDYYYSDESLIDFQAMKFLTKFGMNRYKKDRLDFTRVKMQDDEFVNVDLSSEYQITICGQEAIVLERVILPFKISLWQYGATDIDIRFSVDKTLYTISLWSNERDEEISDDRIEMFWNMVESIECPTD